MGQIYSVPPPAANATVFDIERAEQCSGCSARHWNEQMSQPAAAANWSSQRWMDFSSQMASHVRSFKKEGYALYGLLLIPLGLLILVVNLMMPREERQFTFLDIIHVPFIFLAVLVTTCLSTRMRNANQAIDGKITALCREFSDSSVQLQYVTMYTGACKPKHARTYRGLYMTPGVVQGSVAVAAPPSTQSQLMMVTCPPGVKAGDMIQIMTGAGPMQVPVPAGVSEGAAFQVQVPAPGPVVAAAVVQAVPA